MAQWVAVALLLFSGTLANDNFDIVLERVVVEYENPEYFEINARAFRYNRTHRAITVIWNMTQNFPPDVITSLEGYAFYSNEYRRAPVTITRYLCDVLNMEYLWFKNQMTNTNIPEKCPFLKGAYYIKDFIPTSKDLPLTLNFPWTKVMFALKFTLKRRRLLTFNVYLLLDHDAALVRKWTVN